MERQNNHLSYPVLLYMVMFDAHLVSLLQSSFSQQNLHPDSWAAVDHSMGHGIYCGN